MDRAFILPNCVDLSQFQPRDRDLTLAERYGLESSKVIMTMGRLASQERYKGFDEVIEIMPELLKRFPTVKYLIVGDGPDRPRLESKVAGLGLSNKVIFTGYIPESEKVAHYNLADAYVMPSMGEGFGIVLIEAAACGVSVVGSRVDGDRARHCSTVCLGRLVDPEKPGMNCCKRSGPPLRVRGLFADASMRSILFSKQNFKARVIDWCRACRRRNAYLTVRMVEVEQNDSLSGRHSF